MVCIIYGYYLWEGIFLSPLLQFEPGWDADVTAESASIKLVYKAETILVKTAKQGRLYSTKKL